MGNSIGLVGRLNFDYFLGVFFNKDKYLRHSELKESEVLKERNYRFLGF